MTIAFIRGQYINNFELQSYYPMLSEHRDINLTGFSSLKPNHKVKIPTVKLFSPLDLPDFPKKLPILNRLVLGDAMYLLGLENKLRGYDIAHVRETYFHFSTQTIYAKQKGNIKKVLVTCSETIPFNHETILGRRRLKNIVKNGADHFHALTERAKRCLIDEGISQERITVIPYGVDISVFRPGFKSQKSKYITGLFIGRLESQKGIGELLEVYKKLKSEVPDFQLRVIGKGPHYNKFIEIGIKPETYPYAKIPEIMNNADFLILPSKSDKFWEEYLGMVLLEAMACGLPVISTDCGAIPEVIADAGIIVKQGSSQKLYQAMKEIILNPQLRNKLASMGLRRVRSNFDAKAQSEKIYQLYKKVEKL